MGLDRKSCAPCRGGVPPMERAAAETMLAQAPGWDLSADARTIERRYRFRDFAGALAFVNGVGAIAEREGHHPDISFGWGYCNIAIQTHKIQGLHENDFILAVKINAIPASGIDSD